AHLIFGGVLDDFPGLKVYLPHSGGCVPFLCGRWDQGWRNVKAPREAISRPPSTYLRRFHYDTIAHSGRALSFVVDTVGADRMFLGTDYPFDVGDYQPIDHVQQVGTLSDEDKQRIIELNAPQFFGLA
ncbi:MAG TPA: amidohydrolase family protein, partial [Dehalococcoidia bacterium]|nr:amidohydrolase family protein [Dehalococcoidia bacterium]